MNLETLRRSRYFSLVPISSPLPGAQSQRDRKRAPSLVACRNEARQLLLVGVWIFLIIFQLAASCRTPPSSLFPSAHGMPLPWGTQNVFLYKTTDSDRSDFSILGNLWNLLNRRARVVGWSRGAQAFSIGSQVHVKQCFIRGRRNEPQRVPRDHIEVAPSISWIDVSCKRAACITVRVWKLRQSLEDCSRPPGARRLKHHWGVYTRLVPCSKTWVIFTQVKKQPKSTNQFRSAFAETWACWIFQ